MDQRQTINDNSICLWLLIWQCDGVLKNGSTLGFLTAVNLHWEMWGITDVHAEKKKLLQIALLVLAIDEHVWKKLDILLSAGFLLIVLKLWNRVILTKEVKSVFFYRRIVGFTKSWYSVWPFSKWAWTSSAELGWATFLVPKTNKSGLSSWKKVSQVLQGLRELLDPF